MSFFDLFRWCGFAPNPKPNLPSDHYATIPAGSGRDTYVLTPKGLDALAAQRQIPPSIYQNADGSPRCDYDGLAMVDKDPEPAPVADEPEPPYLEFDPDRAEDYDTDWNDK